MNKYVYLSLGIAAITGAYYIFSYYTGMNLKQIRHLIFPEKNKNLESKYSDLLE